MMVTMRYRENGKKRRSLSRGKRKLKGQKERERERNKKETKKKEARWAEGKKERK